MAHGKILVVEDEKEIARAIGMRLHFAGYEVFTAGDGVEAVRLARETLPDLMIMDIGLPEQNGHETAQRLFTMVETAAIPIIFVTARIADEDRARAYRVGAVAYLTKPFASTALLDAVSRAETISRQMRCGESLSH